MLVESPRHSRADLAAWARAERADAAHAAATDLTGMARRAMDAIATFAAAGPCYAGTSWGKDSTVLAHLVARLRAEGVTVSLVWVVVEPIVNPDCAIVRDTVRTATGVDCDAITVWCRRDGAGWHATGTLERGFALASDRYGAARHVAGIRAEESGSRALRMRRYGVATADTCAPIGWWSARDVYAYLWQYRLPVHPAYACTMGGLLDRDRIRVASLGGQRGTGHGRAEWERRYYGAEMLARGIV